MDQLTSSTIIHSIRDFILSNYTCDNVCILLKISNYYQSYIVDKMGLFHKYSYMYHMYECNQCLSYTHNDYKQLHDITHVYWLIKALSSNTYYRPYIVNNYYMYNTPHVRKIQYIYNNNTHTILDTTFNKHTKYIIPQKQYDNLSQNVDFISHESYLDTILRGGCICITIHITIPNEYDYYKTHIDYKKYKVTTGFSKISTDSLIGYINSMISNDDPDIPNQLCNKLKGYNGDIFNMAIPIYSTNAIYHGLYTIPRILAFVTTGDELSYTDKWSDIYIPTSKYIFDMYICASCASTPIHIIDIYKQLNACYIQTYIKHIPNRDNISTYSDIWIVPDDISYIMLICYLANARLDINHYTFYQHMLLFYAIGISYNYKQSIHDQVSTKYKCLQKFADMYHDIYIYTLELDINYICTLAKSYVSKYTILDPGLFNSSIFLISLL